MLILRCVTRVKTRILPPEVQRKLSSTPRPVEQTSSSQIQEEKFDFEDLKVRERVERRKAKIEPFMKNAYLSDFDRNLLAYPEILNKDEFTEMDERIQKLENILISNDLSPEEKESAVRQTGIYGAPLNLTQNGWAMNVTERIRYLETLSVKPALASRIADHWVGVHAAKVGLPEKTLDRIIPDILNGSQPFSLCTNEKLATFTSETDLRTKATLKGDDGWHVNGEKLCYNPNGYKIVLCGSEVEQTKLKFILVEPNARGVDQMGQYIKFFDTPGHILDQAPDCSFKISTTRLDTAVISYSVLKRLIKQVERHVRGKYVSGSPYSDLPLLRTKVSQAMTVVYTAESMVYFTAGLMDGYVDPDTEMEVAMCRSYVTERVVDSALQLISIAGLEALQDEWNEPLKVLRSLQIKHETLDTLNIYIGLMALEYVGKNLYNEIKKIRNPYFNPGFFLKKIFSNSKQAQDDPNITGYLAEHLHPSLYDLARHLEYCVLRLRWGCERMLTEYGNQVFLQHNDLQRLAQAGNEVLALSSVLARASRSYCIGVRNAEHEMRFASAVTQVACERVRRLVLDIDNGEYANLDNFNKDMGMKILDKGSENLVDSAIARVFW